jgi:hypothetical protein
MNEQELLTRLLDCLGFELKWSNLTIKTMNLNLRDELLTVILSNNNSYTLKLNKNYHIEPNGEILPLQDWGVITSNLDDYLVDNQIAY